MNFRYFLLGFFGIILISSFSIGDAYAEDWVHGIQENIVSTVAIMTAVGTAIGLISSHLVTAHQIKQESHAKFLSLTHNWSNELAVKFDNGFMLKDIDEDGKKVKKSKVKEECVNWAFKYVDSLDELAYIKKEKAIPTKITEYFGPGWFGMAKSLMVWHDEVVTLDNKFNKFRSAIETWPHVYEHCFNGKNNIKYVPTQEFPPLLIKYLKIEDADLEKKSKEKRNTFKKDKLRDCSITHRDQAK